jgi:hypothetical protein
MFSRRVNTRMSTILAYHWNKRCSFHASRSNRPDIDTAAANFFQRVFSVLSMAAWADCDCWMIRPAQLQSTTRQKSTSNPAL